VPRAVFCWIRSPSPSQTQSLRVCLQCFQKVLLLLAKYVAAVLRRDAGG
jgi:hypothetical protein